MIKKRVSQERKPFYKALYFQALAAIIPIVLGVLSIYSHFKPEPPEGIFVEFLIDASGEMLDGDENETKWDAVRGAVSTSLDLEVAETDYVAARIFGGSCSRGETNTKLILPFGKNNENKLEKALSTVRPYGERVLESAWTALTADFADLEKVDGVERRVIAIVGGVSDCASTRMTKGVLERRLRDKYQANLIIIGYQLSEESHEKLAQMADSEVFSAILYANEKGELRDAIESVIASSVDGLEKLEQVFNYAQKELSVPVELIASTSEDQGLLDTAGKDVGVSSITPEERGGNFVSSDSESEPSKREQIEDRLGPINGYSVCSHVSSSFGRVVPIYPHPASQIARDYAQHVYDTLCAKFVCGYRGNVFFSASRQAFPVMPYEINNLRSLVVDPRLGSVVGGWGNHDAGFGFFAHAHGHFIERLNRSISQEPSITAFGFVGCFYALRKSREGLDAHIRLSIEWGSLLDYEEIERGYLACSE